MKKFKEILNEEKRENISKLLIKFLSNLKADKNFISKSELGLSIIYANDRKIIDDFYNGNLPKASSSIGASGFNKLKKMGLISQIKKAKFFKVLKK